MKRWIISILMVASSQLAFAYISGIAIQTEKNSCMQVYVNGKLRTPEAKSFVRIKGNPGTYHVTLKVLNPYDKEWYVLRRNIHVTKGYEFYYKVNFSTGKRPTLMLIKRYPVYSKYFVDPSLYNKHPVS